MSWAFIIPPIGAEPAVLRHHGRRQQWASVCLLLPANDCVDGALLLPTWQAWQHGQHIMSTASMKALMQGGHYQSSHSGMDNQPRGQLS